MKKVLITIFLLFIIVIFLTVKFGHFSDNTKSGESKHTVATNKNLTHTMKITSSAFENQQPIPTTYACDGENINPPLQFSDIPQEAKSLVLIVDDPDAPGGTWVHWVIYNIDPSVTGIEENSKPHDGIEANTSFGKPGYGGPCPPSGTHRYFFKLYALDATLIFDHPEQVDKKLIEERMKDHIIDQAELVGLYSKK